MTVREKAPSILTETGARRLTARIRDALVIADDLLARALEGRIWEPLGYADFVAYCAAELPELRHIKLRTPERRARTKVLIEADPTVTERAIAAATGASPATAHRDVLAVTGREVASNEASHQPVQEPATAPPALVSGYRAAAALVAAQGERGLTVKELAAETGWHHGQSSGALSKAAKRKLIKAVPTFRDGCAAYVVDYGMMSA